MDKLLSIIIPVYNGEKYIDHCLNSLVTQQDFDKSELIIVNDGSKDNTLKIIEKYQSQYPNIKLISQENSGVSTARNKGIENAVTKYLTFMDADDTVKPNYIAAVMPFMNKDYDVICTGMEFTMNHHNSVIKTITDKDKEITSSQAVEMFLDSTLDVHMVNKIFKSSIVKNHPFNTNLRIAEDRLFTFENLAASKNVMLLKDIFYQYLQNEASVMHDEFSINRFDDLYVIKKIQEKTKESFPQYVEKADCMQINVECRLYGELRESRRYIEYHDIYKGLKSDIKKFSLFKSFKNDSLKHSLALLLAKIHPSIYSKFRSNESLKFY